MRTEKKTANLHVRLSHSEMLALYKLGAKHGGLTGAVRHLIRQNDNASKPKSNRASHPTKEPSAVAVN